MNNIQKKVLIFFCIFLFVDLFIWVTIFMNVPPREASIRFLDVGQGDSELVEFAGGIKVMTDAGPDSKIVNSLEKSISHSRKLIDVAIISHPEIDHFNGFNYVLDHYRVGAFVINGRDRPPEIRQWAELMKKIKDQNIPLVTLGEGDSIRYGSNRIDFISPGPQFVASAELNDGALVEKIQTPDFRALFMADAGINVEEYLRGRYDLHADILKVGHHGSKYSSGIEFIRAVQPALAVIEVSARNTYGHPSAITLSRLSASTIPVLRTDKNGTITVWRVAGKIKVSTEN